ncbi:MAG: phosphotransferase [Chthoniobacterales bacterium]|nr:phosphotransferase [Chthoniobacterales bacterium]
MSLSPNQVLEETNKRFPQFIDATLTPIYEGGSDRQFYRCQNKAGSTLIAIHYNNEKEENKHYGTCAHFLKSQQIAVPEILGEDSEQHLLWLQDLGEKNLWSQRNLLWKKRSSLYKATLVEAAKLHCITPKALRQAGLTLQPPFDEQLYQWEQEYFIENALKGLFHIEEKKLTSLKELLAQLLKDLAVLPRQLIHRDLQSQNIILVEDQPFFIDFQGMRWGLAQYDLASLLCDPYVTFTPEEREELLEFYLEEMRRHKMVIASDFKKVFWQCATQRLMQALGCYGFLSLHRGKPKFKNYVAPALKNLREALSNLDPEDRMEELESLLNAVESE